jgi:2-polyprenyl-3-methyl-5-hydroxy-6-metoxy-1,4-benzoquinol methylase
MVFLANPPDYGEYNENFAFEKTSVQESLARKQAEPIRYAVSTALKRIRKHVLKRQKLQMLVRRALSTSSSAQINILDIGCGWSALIEELFRILPKESRARCVPHGIEISRELWTISNEKMLKLGGRCVHAPALDGLAHFKDEYFDAIIMSSYLEHEINPLPVLEHSRARLKPGGDIFIKVPNYACFNRLLRGPRWCGFRWPDHVNYFTPATLKRTAEFAGLEIARMTVLDTNPFSDNMYAVLRRPA